jgi:CHAD domain-containing protein
LAALVSSFEQQREQAYEKALAAVDSQRFRTLVIDVVAWVEAGSWLRANDNPARTEAIKAFAAEELARRRKRARKCGAHLADLDPHDRHKVRIELKKLRYATEFFSPLYDGGKAKKRQRKFLLALESLQEHLGDLNDVAVSQEMHPELFRSHEGVDGGGGRTSPPRSGTHYRQASHSAGRRILETCPEGVPRVRRC